MPCYGWCWRVSAAVGRRPGDLAEGIVRCRAGRWLLCGTVAGGRHRGLLALRSASGLGLAREIRAGLPRQRSTGLMRRSRRSGKSCPGFARGSPRRGGGLALRLIGEEGLGHPGGCGTRRWSGCLLLVTGGMLAGGGAGGDRGIPASVVDDDGVDPAQQVGGALHPGLGATRAGRGSRRADLPRSRISRCTGAVRVIAWYLTAMRVVDQHRPHRAPDGALWGRAGTTSAVPCCIPMTPRSLSARPCVEADALVRSAPSKTLHTCHRERFTWQTSAVQLRRACHR